MRIQSRQDSSLADVSDASVSGEGLFVYHATGRGIIWVQALGAIFQRQLKPGEQWVGAYLVCICLETHADLVAQSTMDT